MRPSGWARLQPAAVAAAAKLLQSSLALCDPTDSSPPGSAVPLQYDRCYKEMTGTSLAVQWLTLCPAHAGGAGLIPGQGTKIPHTSW